MPRCNCEHVAHFRHSTGTPAGKPGHLFDCAFLAEDLVTLVPEQGRGRVTVCLDCALDCYASELVNLIDGATVEAWLSRASRSEAVR